MSWSASPCTCRAQYLAANWNIISGQSLNNLEAAAFMAPFSFTLCKIPSIRLPALLDETFYSSGTYRLTEKLKEALYLPAVCTFYIPAVFFCHGQDSKDRPWPSGTLFLVGVGIGRIKRDTKPVSVGLLVGYSKSKVFFSIPLNRGMGEWGNGG